MARYFLQKTAKELGVEAKVLHQQSLQIMMEYNWSGNVRQLENVCRWLTVMTASQEIMPQDLPQEIRQPDEKVKSVSRLSSQHWSQHLSLWADEALSEGKENILTDALPQFERTLLLSALAYTQGHKQDAARLLGWGRNTLTRKLKELGIEEY